MTDEQGIFCMKCGSKLPAEASFCWKCGAAQKPGSPSSQEQWEKCEITFERQGGIINDGITFFAEAIGPKGRYTAARARKSSQYAPYRDMPPDRENQNVVASHRSLVDQLLREGWEVVESRGSNWWEYRFRRRIG